jgi:hypothetical protein
LLGYTFKITAGATKTYANAALNVSMVSALTYEILFYLSRMTHKEGITLHSQGKLP